MSQDTKKQAAPGISSERVLLDPQHFAQFDVLTLACIAFNGMDQGTITLLGADHSLSREDFQGTIVPMTNSMTALRVMVLRLAGGTIEDFGRIVTKACRPAGVTLQ